VSSPGDESSAEVVESGSSLSLDGRKARYGLAYVRSICSQAGVPLLETEPDEDVLAVDCSIRFPQGDVRVQVKCTSRWMIAGRSLTFPVEQEWVRKWDENFFPVYFVVVIVPKLAAKQWLRHDHNGTFHHTAAFWARLPHGEVGSSVLVPKDQRLMVSTISSWHQDLLEIARPAKGA
jgi:hypothetical protein